MSMKIEFSNGAVLTSPAKQHTVTLVLDVDVYQSLKFALTNLALLEAKHGSVQFAQDLLYLEGELDKALISS